MKTFDIILSKVGSDTIYDVRLGPHSTVHDVRMTPHLTVIDAVVNLVPSAMFGVNLGMVIGNSVELSADIPIVIDPIDMEIGCSSFVLIQYLPVVPDGIDMEIGCDSITLITAVYPSVDGVDMEIGCDSFALFETTPIVPVASGMQIGISAQLSAARRRTLGEMDADTLGDYDSMTIGDVDFITIT